MNPVVFFEIPVLDMGRAMGFYQQVFGFSFEKAEIDGNLMAFFPWKKDASGVSGALALGESYVPGRQGVRIYFHADSITAVLKQVEAIGSKILYPRTCVGKAGWVAEFEDSEGNCIALHEDADG